MAITVTADDRIKNGQKKNAFVVMRPDEQGEVVGKYEIRSDNQRIVGREDDTESDLVVLPVDPSELDNYPLDKQEDWFGR